MSKKPDSLKDKLKRAFRWPWHLLGLGAATGFALLSGDPGTWLPVVAAGEVAYMGILGMHPRFQAVLRLGERSQVPPQQQGNGERFREIMSFLSQQDVTRFDVLRRRCADLLELRRRMESKEESGADHFRGESLDRMLWLFLKLLHQRSGIQRFLSTTQRPEMEKELKSAEDQLTGSLVRDKSGTGVESRLTSSIRERIETIRERIDNHTKAEETLELLTAEIDKTEQRITHLCEVGMTMRDAAGLTVQIDSISDSLESSEISFAHADLSQIFDDETAPPLLSGAPPPLPQRKAISE